MIKYVISLIPCIILMLTSACTSQPVDKPPELLGEANLLISNGVDQYNRANYGKAIVLFDQAMHLYRSIDNPTGIASAYINLAKTAIAQHDIERATYLLAQTHAIVDAEHLDSLNNHLTITDSSIAIEQHDFARAKSLLEHLLDEADKSIEPETRLAAMQNRTRIAFAEQVDAQAWTDRYATLVSDDRPHAQARLARFRAALSEHNQQQDAHFQHALDINRKLAWRPGIAATLSEWAERNISAQNYHGAQNKLERALLIRLDLEDNINTAEVLRKLEIVYRHLGEPGKQQRAAYWQSEVAHKGFYNWDDVMRDFETVQK